MNDYRPSEHIAEIIEGAFVFHPVHSDQGERYTAMRAEAKKLADFIAKNTPASAEQTLAIRKLQECIMFANAAIAIHEA